MAVGIPVKYNRENVFYCIYYNSSYTITGIALNLEKRSKCIPKDRITIYTIYTNSMRIVKILITRNLLNEPRYNVGYIFRYIIKRYSPFYFQVQTVKFDTDFKVGNHLPSLLRRTFIVRRKRFVFVGRHVKPRLSARLSLSLSLFSSQLSLR